MVDKIASCKLFETLKCKTPQKRKRSTGRNLQICRQSVPKYQILEYLKNKLLLNLFGVLL